MFSIHICVAYMAQRTSPTAVLHRELTMSLPQSSRYQQSTALTQYTTQYQLVLYSENTEPVSGLRYTELSQNGWCTESTESVEPSPAVSYLYTWPYSLQLHSTPYGAESTESAESTHYQSVQSYSITHDDIVSYSDMPVHSAALSI